MSIQRGVKVYMSAPVPASVRLSYENITDSSAKMRSTPKDIDADTDVCISTCSWARIATGDPRQRIIPAMGSTHTQSPPSPPRFRNFSSPWPSRPVDFLRTFQLRVREVAFCTGPVQCSRVSKRPLCFDVMFISMGNGVCQEGVPRVPDWFRGIGQRFGVFRLRVHGYGGEEALDIEGRTATGHKPPKNGQKVCAQKFNPVSRPQK
ncbi:hypothetical protein AG1IA_07372 [Rhizoctonia solani AG-1 IA]|uniref:Uncharacterized protein n=1 Tax=Thanatephorus cucumeris (strain AG1-IA) TaxID=983506 RepID=L8WQI4_THACA|nr:hypothetical protein AG1IA_07372 [Rhizoctonia solani AG-1 IA]